MRKVTKAIGLLALILWARHVSLQPGNEDAVRQNPPGAPPSALVTGSVTKSAALAANGLGENVRAILGGAVATTPIHGGIAAKRPGDAGWLAFSTGDADSDEGVVTGGTGLVEDNDASSDKPHPLSSEHPDDFLVICEAGCRPQSDRIVYRISKMSAAAYANAQRKMEPNSALPETAQPSGADAVMCIAGCYDDPAPVRHAQKQSPATASTTASAERTTQRLAALTPQARAAQAQAPQTPAPAQDAATQGQQSHPQPAPAKAEAAADPASAETAAQVLAILNTAATSRHTARSPLSNETRAPVQKSQPLRAVAAKADRGWLTQVQGVVALAVPGAPFETTVSVESGWEWQLVNTP